MSFLTNPNITYYADDIDEQTTRVELTPNTDELVKLLSECYTGQQMTFHAYRIDVEETHEQLVTLHFIRSDHKVGVLHNFERTVYWIYHDGHLNNFPIRPCLSDLQLCENSVNVWLGNDEGCGYFIPNDFIFRQARKQKQIKRKVCAYFKLPI